MTEQKNKPSVEEILNAAPLSFMDEDIKWLLDHGFWPNDWDDDIKPVDWVRMFLFPDEDDDDRPYYDNVFLEVKKYEDTWHANAGWNTAQPPEGISEEDGDKEGSGNTPLEALTELNKNIDLAKLLRIESFGGQIQ